MIKNYYEGKRVLVTGGLGFIGSHLASKLRELGAEVSLLDTRYTNPSNGPFVGVANLSHVAAAFSRYNPEIVFHLAAFTEVRRSHEVPYLAGVTNIQGTLNILEACRSLGVQSLVVASSDKAYGYKQFHDLPYEEEQGLCTYGDWYSRTKRITDLLSHDYASLYKLPITVLRSANTYGPGQTNQTTLITNTIIRLLSGKKPVLHKGYQGVAREWLYVEDAVKAYLWAGEWGPLVPTPLTERGQRAFNVGSGCSCSNLHIVQELLQMFGKPADWYDLIDCPNVQIGDQWLDHSRLARAYKDWRPIELKEGLQRTVDWYKSQTGAIA